MNEWDRLHRQAKRYKVEYPPGTRIMLLSMGEDVHRVKDNTRGTVLAVDDIGTGAMLGVIPGEDSFRKLTEEELAEEQEQDQDMDEDEDENFGMKM
mgnify:CR=1 FL=1